jgi:23S rRNA pseudouridine1911/1915/1917 synthase
MPDTATTLRFTADRGDARLRLDQVLVRRITDVSRLSRNVAQRWIASGAVTVDGRVARRTASPVREGAAVAVVLPPDTVLRERPGAEAGHLDVLYEDEWLLAVNKPAGLVVHPSYKQPRGTLLNRVLWRLQHRSDAAPGILTRLDKETSGVVAIALDAGVHAALQRAAASGAVSKHYLAVVDGRPSPRAGHISDPLGRDPADRRRVVVTPGGAPSETRYEVIGTGRGLSMIRCELVTGRTHQIRVHLASRGWPVVGDRVYGSGDPRIARQALHAWRLDLRHPITGAAVQIEAAVPADMRGLLDICAPP